MASNESLTTSVTTVHPGRTLGECLGKYLDEQTDTDVSFRVGEDKVEVKAHRMVLQCRSPVFSRMLSQTFHDGGDIEIKDTSDDNFKTLIRFLYTDQANLNEENAIPVLHLADKYDVPLLYDRCVKFLNNNIKIENACLIFASAKRYNSETLKIASLSFICLNKDCLRSDEFLNLCREDVMDISGNENLSCREEHLLESLCGWAEVRCNETGKEPNDANKRKILGDLLFTVRFPLIHYEYLIKILSKGELLTDSELKQILQLRSEEEEEEVRLEETDDIEDTDEDFTKRLASNSHDEVKEIAKEIVTKKSNCDVINRNARNAMQPENIILGTGPITLSKEVIKEEQNISFTVSEDSWFYGMILYGPETEQKFAYELRLICNNGSFETVATASSFTESNTKSYTYNLPFDSPIFLIKMKRYSCRVLVFSNPLCRFYRLKVPSVIQNFVLPRTTGSSFFGFQQDSSHIPQIHGPGFSFSVPSTKNRNQEEITVTHLPQAVVEKAADPVHDRHPVIVKTFRHKTLTVTSTSCHVAGVMIF